MPILDLSLTDKTFLEGPAGCGKTTLATQYVRQLLEAGTPPERILVLVPQATYGRPYQLAVHAAGIAGGTVDILTHAGVARRAVETYWPLVAEKLGFAEPQHEPIFLNIETAQHYMARVAAPLLDTGQFDGVQVAPPRIVSQVLDNLNKAAMLRFPLDEIAQRLTLAWSDQEERVPPAFDAAIDLARQFRAYCLEHNLLDYSLVVEAFDTVLRADPLFSQQFLDRYDYLIADNIEESNPATHDFIKWLLPHTLGVLLIFDVDGGYRVFLGADPDYGYDLHQLCTRHEKLTESQVNTPAMLALGYEFNRTLGPVMEQPAEIEVDPMAAFQFEYHLYYPQMIDWMAERIIDLVKTQGVEPRQIAVLSPYLSDSLRFGLTYRLRQAGIPTLSHRPSRSLRDEQVTKTMLTLTMLVHPGWAGLPPLADVADALTQVIDGLDPVRARLLAQIVYRPASGELTSFTLINTEMQSRITYLSGERFDVLREWLAAARANAGTFPLDHFLRRLFGEMLSQPGYRYHGNLEAGRIVGQLVESAQRFRQTLYPDHTGDWHAAGREYLSLIEKRFLSALYVQSWQDEEANAVFISPAFTFLMRNRIVDYQFWVDVGSSSWWERLEQPLTHPYVLRRTYPRDLPWTDDMEVEAQTGALYRVIMGLTRRCRQRIYLGISSLGEEGYEQRGPLLRVFQRILRRYIPDAPDPGPLRFGNERESDQYEA